MSDIILKVENLSKQYRLGKIGTGTLSHDLNRWWHTVRGKEDPYLKVGEVNDRSSMSNNQYVWALKDINFEVQQGEVLGIIGKNGAGKSTLLKILSRVTSPTVGSVKAKGRIASLLEVGTGFHPEMTGRENIFLNGAILGMTKKEIASKLDEIIDFSGCKRYIDTPVKRYSSGMTVRLAFAVAAHLEPEILVVDEVLAVGDAEFQKKAIGKMQDISKTDGRTVLFVSHNMAAVKSLCTKGIVLEHGGITFSGTSDDAINYYLENSYKKSEIKLSERIDRKGNQKLSILNIFVKNKDEVVVGEMHSGEYYKLIFEYQKQKDIDPKQLTIVLQFKNENDELVTTIATDELGTKFSEVKEKGTIEVEIPRLQFREGRYSMQYMISEKLSFNTPHQVVDYLQDAFTLTVIRGDYWHSGVLNRPKGFIQEASIQLL
ncbi:ABC transporter ATP-binding protein [Flavobacterium piscinae]|uniref:ABC transporter ATP-binding protein n=1 Tax=Flavobacterium piscinae TaxID=2506424 RepID=A0A4Q1KTX5_9FLAO|nr:ABC transporter ATP-binding protein [Flavobacterium piscinae]RXR33090.1 ABC transporter ATP-binding protein [Flavobacterium piscinae]